MQSLIKCIFIMKMNVLHMVRNHVGTIKIMLNRKNNEVTNVKIRKKKCLERKIKTGTFLHMQINRISQIVSI